MGRRGTELGSGSVLCSPAKGLSSHTRGRHSPSRFQGSWCFPRQERRACLRVITQTQCPPHRSQAQASTVHRETTDATPSSLENHLLGFVKVESEVKLQPQQHWRTGPQRSNRTAQGEHSASSLALHAGLNIPVLQELCLYHTGLTECPHLPLSLEHLRQCLWLPELWAPGHSSAAFCLLPASHVHALLPHHTHTTMPTRGPSREESAAVSSGNSTNRIRATQGLLP
ncbi:PREDICTED: uncharacterized protein LOC106146379 [Chinchilla lanigera]|uniref:uncharacterized protein LOC106146379 n=1 Tax=Chinchilla lanigera TaxID=34839 RepID=UPI00069754F0|nr:PREDICTED: uncharacterized protein LOC106146379 [Chinchilla lanigera]